MFRLLLLVCFTISIAICASKLNITQKLSKKLLTKSIIDQRIIGGTEIDIKEIPYQVSIQKIIIGHSCGGSLISKYCVITAAHCVITTIPYFLSVRIGSSIHNNGGILVHVKDIIKHPFYDSSDGDYDIAILKLKNWNSKNITHDYIKLAKKNFILRDNVLLNVSGWGLYNKNLSISSSLSRKLRIVEVKKINQRNCKSAYKNIHHYITNRMICAGFNKDGKDSCKGDSGGPLVEPKKKILVGIVSWGMDCGKAKYPGVYTSIMAVRDWINHVTGI